MLTERDCTLNRPFVLPLVLLLLLWSGSVVFIVLDADLGTKNTTKINPLPINELLCIMTISHICQGTATPELTVEGKSLKASPEEEDCLSTQTAKRTEHLIITEMRKWISRWKKFKLIMSGTSPDGRGGTSFYEVGTMQRCKQQTGSAQCILKPCIPCS